MVIKVDALCTLFEGKFPLMSCCILGLRVRGERNYLPTHGVITLHGLEP